MRAQDTVISELKSAVGQERACTLKVLYLLQEVENDRHYLQMGYPSLFEFALKELGYSAASAHRRVQAMRLLKSMPEIEAKIEEGSLSLCVAAKTQSFFRKEEILRKETGKEKLGQDKKKEIVASMIGVSSRECERKLLAISPEAAQVTEKERVISDNKTVIQFVATQELMRKIEKLKGLLAHQNFEGKYAELFEILADLALKKLDPEKKHSESKKASENKKARMDANFQLPVASVPTPETSLPTVEMQLRSHQPSQHNHLRSRYIPPEIKRKIWIRDEGCCTFRDFRTNKQCTSTYALQYDHIRPFSWGGETSERNLRLRCHAHNAFTAEKQRVLNKRAG